MCSQSVHSQIQIYGWKRNSLFSRPDSSDQHFKKFSFLWKSIFERFAVWMHTLQIRIFGKKRSFKFFRPDNKINPALRTSMREEVPMFKWWCKLEFWQRTMADLQTSLKFGTLMFGSRYVPRHRSTIRKFTFWMGYTMPHVYYYSQVPRTFDIWKWQGNPYLAKKGGGVKIFWNV